MHVVYEDREEAGRRLAKSLRHYHSGDAVVMAIPRGGVPVAAVVAHRLELEWNVIVARKLPIPWSPEAGFGAVAADGSVVLNEPMLAELQMTRAQIDAVADQVRTELIRRTQALTSIRPPVEMAGRTVIVIDDGLASGYTMLAAIKSLRSQLASRIVAASPVASRTAAALIQSTADECVFEITSQAVPFAVADFYVRWHDLNDDEVIGYLTNHKELAPESKGS